MDDQEFLKELQEDFFAEADENIARFREHLNSFSSNPEQAIDEMMKICHNMKGELRAVGFQHFSGFIHTLEDNLTNLKSSLNKDSDESDIQIAEFLLSDVIQGTEFYLKKVRETGKDSQSLRDERKTCMDMLANFVPSSGDTPEPSPAEEAPNPVAAEVESVAETSTPIEAPPQTETPSQNEASVPAEAKTEKETPKETSSPSLTAKKKTPKAQKGKKKKEEKEKREFLFLVFENAKRNFALQIENVVEVVRSQSLVPFPKEKDGFLGLLNLRGEALPILDLSNTLSDSENSQDKTQPGFHPNYVVIASLEGKRFGFEVDFVKQVRPLEREKFQVADNLIEDSKNNLITHFYTGEEKPISVIDLGKIVAA